MNPALLALASTLGLVTAAVSQDRLFALRGTAAGNRTGACVAFAGDLNGDGYADVIVGEPGDGTNGNRAGRARVFSGRDGMELLSLVGDTAGDEFGWAVAGVGDVDKDGVPDVVVGAPFAIFNGVLTGKVRVFSGKDGAPLFLWTGSATLDAFGISVADPGDVNQDGWPDILVGAHATDTNGSNCGSARVFSGKDGGLLRILHGDAAQDYFGHSVSGVGDLNGDGHPDFAVGAPDDDNNGPQSGMARVFSGKDGSLLHQWDGDAADDFFGHAVRGAGDVDKDGTPDVIVGAVQFFGLNPGTGYARIFSGKTGLPLRTLAGATKGDFFGEPVAGVGDVNGDGYADVLVGAHREDDQSNSDAGAAYLYSGKDGTVLKRLAGAAAGAHFGHFVAGGGDANKDGTPDFVVGMPATGQSPSVPGAAWVVSGGPMAFFADVHTLSLATGGTQTMSLRAGVEHAGFLYLVLGGMSGIANGLLIPPKVQFPVDPDSYMVFTLTSPNTLIQASFGALDGNGDGTASFVLPTGQSTVLLGVRFDHAYTLIDLSKLMVVTASNSVPLTLVQ